MKFFASLVAVTILAGCTYGTKIKVGGQSYAPVPISHVQVLTGPPPTPFTVIGIVSAKGAHLASDSSVYRKLQKAAADLGADAVIVGSEAVVPYGTIPGSSYTYGNESATVNAYASGVGNSVYGNGYGYGTFNSTTTYTPPVTLTGLVVKGTAIKFGP